MNKYYRIFKKVAERYPGSAGDLIIDGMVNFFNGRFGFAETLEDFAIRAGIDKKEFLGFLEKVI